MRSRMNHQHRKIRDCWRCPPDANDVVDAVFRLRDRLTDSLFVQGEGCQFVTNGRVGRWAWYQPGPRLIDWLFSHTGCRTDFRSVRCPSGPRPGG